MAAALEFLITEQDEEPGTAGRRHLRQFHRKGPVGCATLPDDQRVNAFGAGAEQGHLPLPVQVCGQGVEEVEGRDCPDGPAPAGAKEKSH